MKVIGGDFPREGVDRDGNDDAWMGFGGGEERFANVLDRNLILHMAEMIRVFVYMDLAQVVADPPKTRSKSYTYFTSPFSRSCLTLQ